MSEISSSKSELKKLYKSVPFTQYDVGWVILCIGMAIGSGIVFMPVQVGIKGFGSLLLRLLFRILQFIYCRISICVHFLNLITVLIIPVSLRNI